MISVGDIFGKLTVTKLLTNSSVKTHNIVTCKCLCGNEIEVSERNLSRGTKSCGCAKFNTTKDPDRISVLAKRRYTKLKSRHNQKSTEEVISFDKFKELISSPCFYCGVSHCTSIQEENFELLVNGIDRIDSDKGYTENNTVSCCTKCNYAKNTMTVTDFKGWITMIYKNFVEANK